jgi:hypothetical protein
MLCGLWEYSEAKIAKAISEDLRQHVVSAQEFGATCAKAAKRFKIFISGVVK